MPELTRLQIQNRRKRWLELQRKKLEDLTEGAKSDLVPHSFEIDIQEEIVRQCFYCHAEQPLKSRELDGKYCRKASIELAKQKGTYNPDYKGV